MVESNKVVITVLGVDKVGIIAGISTVLTEIKGNIVNISQSLLGDLFAMVMMVDMSQATVDLSQLKVLLDRESARLGVQIIAQHEDIFRYMHRVE